MLNLKLNARIHFMKEFLRSPAKVGAIAPSSVELAIAMTRDLRLIPGEAILELGPGTGAFTGEIYRIIPDHSAYVGIECEPKFVELLQKKFPDLLFINGYAQHSNLLMKEAGITSAKVIISGIPFALLVNEVCDLIIENLNKLMSPGCMFRTFQYVHAYPLPSAMRFRKRMNELLGEYHRSRVIFKNLPPAYVLTWVR